VAVHVVQQSEGTAVGDTLMDEQRKSVLLAAMIITMSSVVGCSHSHLTAPTTSPASSATPSSANTELLPGGAVPWSLPPGFSYEFPVTGCPAGETLYSAENMCLPSEVP
jgi:hypothetical protein